MFFFMDPLYLWVFLIALGVSLAAQAFVSNTYRHYSRVRNGPGMTGLQVGQAIVQRTALGDDRSLSVQASAPGLQVEGIRFAAARGQLTDHYDPRQHTVFLSEGVATQPSVAAMAIVAHELGHAEQKERSSALMALRGFLVPAAVLSPQIAYALIFIGLLFNILSLVWLGILFFALMVVFIVVELPVEIDASRRALQLLEQAGLLHTADDRQGTRRMLTAAASTYVAAAVTAVLQLLYYISLGRRRA